MRKLLCVSFCWVAAFWFTSVQSGLGQEEANERQSQQSEAAKLPPDLQDWQSWVLWGAKDKDAPKGYDDAEKKLAVWPSRMKLELGDKGGSFAVEMEVFAEQRVALPKGAEIWPQAVKVDGMVAPVVELNGWPTVFLQAGTHLVEGEFAWASVPQKLEVPRLLGLLDLSLNGQRVDYPQWNENGTLWLKRDSQSEVVDKDYLTVKMNSLVRDGIPMWIDKVIDISVSGKNREEVLGNVLPDGWSLASVSCDLPVAVDANGVMKAQVRGGKWEARLTAFRYDHEAGIAYAPSAKPAAAEEYVAFQADPKLRQVDVEGVVAIDASQAVMPDEWKSHPVYRWETDKGLQLVERMRGMGKIDMGGVKVNRELWLDEDGKGLTYRDQITGALQDVWRLDAAKGYELGAVRDGEVGQLVTLNPLTGTRGIEVRKPQLDLEATGRIRSLQDVQASGWVNDVRDLRASLNLPPGWRLLALFGADWVDGDWLTSWTLMDLFLLLIFTLAVHRLWGWKMAVLAFFAFGLSYHENNAPRYFWLLLLVPVVLLRVVPKGAGRQVAMLGFAVCALGLVWALVPYLSQQTQLALYPQMEFDEGAVVRESATIVSYSADGVQNAEISANSPYAESMRQSSMPVRRMPGLLGSIAEKKAMANMLQDAKARVQTGPGVPTWHWRAVSYGWDGPVKAGQTVRAILVPEVLGRGLAALRVVLLLVLAIGLLRKCGGSCKAGGKMLGKAAAAVAVFFIYAAGAARAEIPSQEMLAQLRGRLLESPDDCPVAADIPHVKLKLDGVMLTMDAEVHVARRCGVPLPGRLEKWAPLSVTVGHDEAPAVLRTDGSVWVLLDKGVHHVRVVGMLAGDTEWQWSYQLRPRKVVVEAPGWQVSGVRPSGEPEGQVFFSRAAAVSGVAVSEEHSALKPAVEVVRELELGLVWQVRTTVRRLSPKGVAISLRVPLIKGENVLDARAQMTNEMIDVRLGAQDEEYAWVSDLPIEPRLDLATRADDAWVEKWLLHVSPVWNVSYEELAPMVEEGALGLMPVWKPWPGEKATLSMTRPEAVEGETLTVSEVQLETTCGERQRASNLRLLVRASMGSDLVLALPEGAQISKLQNAGRDMPVRMQDGKVVVALQPGHQEVMADWKSDVALSRVAKSEVVGLSVPSANVTTTLRLPSDRWVLWTWGPTRGPAVRFWAVLLGALIVAFILGRVELSPLRTIEWMLLTIGLTQIPVFGTLVVVGWLFALAWRGKNEIEGTGRFDLFQLVLVVLTVVSLGVLVFTVSQGLLGSPEMWIGGNGSSARVLRWDIDRCDAQLSGVGCVSISIWWYRLLMLLWALWLAASLLKWLRWGWHSSARAAGPGSAR